MILRIIIDLLIAVSLYFAIAGTIGINKMPDTFSRMQASTLITTLGVLGANIGASHRGYHAGTAQCDDWCTQ